jgi:hypothetical protein
MNMKPVIEELKPLSEVIAEENASRVNSLPGRYHHYLGAE